MCVYVCVCVCVYVCMCVSGWVGVGVCVTHDRYDKHKMRYTPTVL